VPLIISSGAGTETRLVIGIVILSGVIVGTLFTLFIVPAAYDLVGKYTDSPEAVARRLEQALAASQKQ
jgi:multidrug efflux pump